MLVRLIAPGKERIENEASIWANRRSQGLRSDGASIARASSAQMRIHDVVVGAIRFAVSEFIAQIADGRMAQIVPERLDEEPT